MKTKIKIILSNLIVVWISLLMQSSIASASSSEFSSTATMDIVWWAVTIFSPEVLDFGSGKVLTQDTDLTIDMLTHSWWTQYFGVEDLKWSDSWYILSMMMEDLTSSGISAIIPKVNTYITLSNANSWITVLWQVLSLSDLPPQITIPSVITRRSLWSSVDVLQRHEATTPTSWIVWKYWIQPIITVLIPRYQQIGAYRGVLVLTLTEN